MPKYRILSLDGGGIRGLATAIWLQSLEQKLGGKLRDHFELIAGTSTGSILACAVSLGIPAADIISLYKDRGRNIFPGAAKRLWSRGLRVFTQGPSAPKYDPSGLEKELQGLLGKTKTFGSLPKPTMVFSYNLLTREPVAFKTWKAEHKNLPVWEVARASCSAPTYFPAMVMKMGNAKQPLVDGGVAANNPSACAVAEGIRLNMAKPKNERVDLEDFVLASFGTGSLMRPISIEDSQEWGAIEWAIPIIDVLFDGSTDTSDYVTRQILEENNYFRFQMELNDAYDDMDNADSVNLNALSAAAQGYLSQGGDALLGKLVARLG